MWNRSSIGFFFLFWQGQEVTDNLSTKLRSFTDIGMVVVVGWGGGVVWGTNLPPLPYKPLSNFATCWAISLLAEDVSLLKLTILLILRRFFQWCPRCSPYWSMFKVKNCRSSKAKNGILFDWKVTNYLWKILFTCTMSASVFFSAFYWQ